MRGWLNLFCKCVLPVYSAHKKAAEMESPDSKTKSKLAPEESLGLPSRTAEDQQLNELFEEVLQDSSSNFPKDRQANDLFDDALNHRIFWFFCVRNTLP